MEKKIYIVTSGEYSDYGIEAVFSTKEAAEKYATISNSTGGSFGYDYIVETYGVDVISTEAPTKVFARVFSNGVVSINSNEDTNIEDHFIELSDDSSIYVCVVRYSENKEVMIKAARDKRAQAEAEKEGVL